MKAIWQDHKTDKIDKDEDEDEDGLQKILEES